MMETIGSALLQESVWHAEATASGLAVTLPLRARPGAGSVHRAAALVASSREEALQTLSEIVAECGLSALPASTAAEAKGILRRQKVRLIVCENALTDGNYEDILRETARLFPKTPVIVVSQTGDWPEYLKAVAAGAFDYLPYPPDPADLPRVIRCALAPRATRAAAVRIAGASRS